MNKYDEILAKYYGEIAHHELLGREGEIALAKQIEDREIEVWRRLLAFAPALPIVLQTLENQGLALPVYKSLRRAATIAARNPSKASKDALTRRADATATQVRENDRDRHHLDAVLAAIDSQSPKGRGRAKWRQGVATAERAAAAARQRFVNSNLRFVVSMCRKFAGHGVAMEDLIQEGNIGLIKGVDRFDYRRGYRFSTYAGWWIRHSIGRAVADTARTVRVPVHVQDMNQQISRAHRELASKLGRDPTNEEIADRCAISAEKVVATRGRVRSPAISLDEPLGEDGTTRLDQLVGPANDERSLLDDLLGSQEIERVKSLLDTLTSIQADVLRKRFGLEGETPMTLRAIGEKYGLSRERIRQIQSTALQALRSHIEKQDELPGPRAAAR